MNEREITSVDLVEGGNVIKQGHYLTLGFIPRDVDGNAVDLTGKNIAVALYNKKQIIYETTATFSGGVLRFAINEIIESGNAQVEFTATSSTDAGYRQKFPTNKNDGRLSINRSSDDLDYFGMPVITVSQFREEFDQAINALPVDSEINLARIATDGTVYPHLTARLEAEQQETAALLTETEQNKVDKNGAGQVSLAMLAQDAKTAMTGGSVAIVGNNVVDRNKILEGEVTSGKLEMVEIGVNKFNVNDKTNIIGNFLSAGDTLNANDTTGASHFIPVKIGDIVRFTKTGGLFGPTTGGAIIGGSLYDSVRAYSAQINETNTTEKGTHYEFTSPLNGYIKFNYRTTAKNVCVINIPFPSVFKEYKAVIKEKSLPIVQGSRVADKTITEDNVSFIGLGTNKFNVDDTGNKTGVFVSNSNVETVEATSGISHLIKVNPGDVVRFTKTGSLFGATGSTTITGGSIFNEDKSYIGAISGSNTVALATYYEHTVPTDVMYIQFNYRTTANNVLTINEAFPAGFRSFKRSLSKKVTFPINPEFLKHMHRSALCIGDSLTKGAYYDPIKNGSAVAENYPYYLAKMTDWVVTNGGQSGYTALQWYDNLASTFNYAEMDAFVICLGTNGGLTDTLEADTTGSDYTLYANTNTGAYCKIIERVLATNPKAFIYLTNIFSSSGSLSTTNTVIKKIAVKYNLPIINIMESFGDEVMHPFGNSVHFGKVGNIHLAKTVLDGITEDMLNDPTRYEVLLM